jgi:hypothetical protein
MEYILSDKILIMDSSKLAVIRAKKIKRIPFEKKKVTLITS